VPTFPGIYQAKATKINGTGIECQVPQIFGDTTITVQRFTSGIPANVGTGWVQFVGGNPEYPVWSSGGVGGTAGPPGPRGPQGPIGPQGPQGIPGEDGT
jgi:hypothetical protein